MASFVADVDFATDAMHDSALLLFHSFQKFVSNNLLLHGVPYVDSAVEEASQGILRRISSTFFAMDPRRTL